MITSAELKSVRALKTKKGREEHQAFLIEGDKIVQDAAAADWEISRLFVTREAEEEKREWLGRLGQSYEVVDSRTMDSISTVMTPPGVIGVVRQPSYRLNDALLGPIIVAVAGVSDPGNLGSIIRTADWFGVTGIILSPDAVDPYNEKVVRAAMGSLFHVKLFESHDLESDLRQAKAAGYHLIAAEAHGSTGLVGQFERLCLVMGSEAAGLPRAIQEITDSVYTIPGRGKAESLNVAVSFGIILNELVTRAYV
ncbi:RNA methyltransferase [Patescibacteria group bacterium]|nr:RNA methyltransferase [Patescibacteria group bacterium]